MDEEWLWKLPREYAYVHSNVAVTQRAHPGLTISEAGDISAIDVQNQMVTSNLHRVGLLAIPVTLLVLLLAFVSLVTALVPLLLGLIALAAGLGLVGQISHAFPVQDSAETVILLIGLSWLPLFLFVTLFGLSMDDPVVILSRIREAVSGEPVRQAIRLSIRRTADVVTATALVMVCVFALFGTLASLDLKQAGAGLTVAVLIDATVIRSVLLPAAMTVLGEQNWYLPRWLAWLSRLGLEPPGVLHLDRTGMIGI
jgi:putative drug exporter of the RND superfamily